MRHAVGKTLQLGVESAHFRLRRPPFGVVLDREQEAVFVIARPEYLGRVQHQAPPPHARKIVFDPEGIEIGTLGHDPAEAVDQRRDVPGPARQIGQTPALHLHRGDPENTQIGAIGRDHPQIRVEHHEGLPDGGDDGLVQPPRLLQDRLLPLQALLPRLNEPIARRQLADQHRRDEDLGQRT